MVYMDADGTISIEYGALKTHSGFIPVLRRTGRAWNWEHVRAFDLDVALEYARKCAENEAARYVGDWMITVRSLGEVQP
jgi:hypothetical protein